MARRDDATPLTPADRPSTDEAAFRAGELRQADQTEPNPQNFLSDPARVRAEERDTPGDPRAEGKAAKAITDPDVREERTAAGRDQRTRATSLIYRGVKRGADGPAEGRTLETAVIGFGDAAYWTNLHGFGAAHAGHAIDLNAPSGRSYHFALGVPSEVHPADAAFFTTHGMLQFEKE